MDVFFTVENGDYNDIGDVSGDIAFELDAGGADFVLLHKEKLNSAQVDLWFEFLRRVKTSKKAVQS